MHHPGGHGVHDVVPAPHGRMSPSDHRSGSAAVRSTQSVAVADAWKVQQRCILIMKCTII